LEVAIHYYSILSILGDWRLSKRDLELLAFASLRGSLSSTTGKSEFCTLFKSSIHTINNIVSKLKRKGLLVKEGSKIKVHPRIKPEFENLKLELNLWINQESYPTKTS
jgi:hypothetical protein